MVSSMLTKRQVIEQPRTPTAAKHVEDREYESTYGQNTFSKVIGDNAVKERKLKAIHALAAEFGYPGNKKLIHALMEHEGLEA